MELSSVKPLCRMCGGFRPPRTSARMHFVRKPGVLLPKRNFGFDLRPAGRRLCVRMTPLQATPSNTITEVLWGMTIPELKKILRKSEAPSSGSKANLIARVISLAEANDDLLHELMPEGSHDREEFLSKSKPAQSVPATQSIANSSVRSPAASTDNMVLLDELSQRTVAELREDLQSLGMPSSGRKMDLVMRLAAAMQDTRLEEKKKVGGKEGALAEKLLTLQGMTMAGLIAFLEDRGNATVHNLTQAQLLEKCQREVQREFYQSGERISRNDFEALLNRQVETRRPECYSVMEIRKRLRDLNESVEGTRAELAPRLEAAVERCHKITDAVTIRLDALAEEWFQNTTKDCEEGTLLDGLDEMEVDEVETQLRRRSLKPLGNVEESRRLLRTALSVELGISSKALADLATSLIDKVYTLTEPAIRMLLDMDPHARLSTTRKRECCDVIILRLAPRLMDIFDREIQVEEASRQSIGELKDDPMRLERELAEAESMDPSMTIAVVFGGGGDAISDSLASLRCLLDQLQTAKYHVGENVENDPPNKKKKSISDGALAGVQVIPYLMNEEQRMYRLTAANAFSLDEASIRNGAIPVGAALVGDLTDWVSEMKEVDLVFPLIHGAMATAGEFREAIDALEAPCLGTSGEAAATATDKFRVFEILQEKRFPLLPIFPMTKKDLEDAEAWYQAFVRWCQGNGYDLATSKFVIKSANRGAATTGESAPLEAGEAIGVARNLLSDGLEDSLVLEEYVATNRAAEFECWVIDTQEGPIALLPTEIEHPPSELIRPLASTKRHHTPARMDLDKIQSIRMAAVGVFKACGLRDFARIQGLMMMDNSPEARKVKILPPVPRPIPKGVYKEELDEEDSSPEFEAALNDVWAEHVKEVNEAIEEWETTEEDPLALEFKKWLFTEEPCEGIDPENLPDPVPEMKEYRDRRPGPIVEDFSDVDAFVEQLNQEPDVPVDYEDLCTGSNYTVVVTDVNLSGSFQSSSLLFQQAACVGLSHSSLLRHFVNLALARAGLDPLTSLPPEPKLWNPLFNDLYPKEQGTDDVDDDDEDEADEDYYEKEYGMDGEPTEDSASEDIMAIFSEPFEEEAASGEEEEAWEEAQQKDRAQQIWVLCGGDGPGQQISFHSGINAWLKLRRSNDLQVTPSVLIPEEYSSGKRERLESLLDRRNRFLNEGVPEEVVDTYEDLTLEYIRNPKPMGCQLDWRMVMTLDPVSALAPTLDEALESAERRLLATNTAPTMRDTEMVGMLESELICQHQLAFAGVQGVGGLWGGELESAPIARMMTLHFYALEAQSLRSIVHLAMHGDLAEDGTLQHFLEDYDILYTGSNETAAGLCLDKSQVSTRLDPEGSPEVLTTPNRILDVEQLVGASSDIEACEKLFEESASDLANSQKLCIKPMNGTIGSGVARLQCARDVQLYGQALKCRAAKIETLSGLHSSVSLMLSNPSKFLLEPYFPTGPYKWNGDALEIEGNSPWVELTIGLIGGLGAMRAFTPSLVMRSVESPIDFDRKFTFGQDDVLTPVPSSIFSPEMVRAMQDKAQGVADRLGLAGVAQIDAFLHVETGEMLVIEVDTSPNLGPSSPILRQAALEKTPVYPDEFFREMVIVAATPFSVEESFEEEEDAEVYSDFDQELDFV
ncbi:hypothetical protein BSKO_08634 [Bryopsis sp. KO-2023]|nr:hypothetical protein BSKO_08634 [Bryopsis sp. KO-2023]